VTITATSEGRSGSAAITVTVAAGISYVQSNANGSGALTLSVPLLSTTAPGDLVVVGFDFAGSFASISDNQGNVFTQIGTEIITPAGSKTRLYYARNIKGGPETVTVNLTGTPGLEVYVTEYHGASTTNPLDVTAQRTGPAGSVTSGSAVTTSANDLIMGFCVGDAACSAGTGFSARSTFNHNLIEDRTVSATGSYAATGSATAGWAIILAAFRP
jgi:hypothetical protein